MRSMLGSLSGMSPSDLAGFFFFGDFAPLFCFPSAASENCGLGRSDSVLGLRLRREARGDEMEEAISGFE